jgi:hypothetical protein
MHSDARFFVNVVLWQFDGSVVVGWARGCASGLGKGLCVKERGQMRTLGLWCQGDRGVFGDYRDAIARERQPSEKLRNDVHADERPENDMD